MEYTLLHLATSSDDSTPHQVHAVRWSEGLQESLHLSISPDGQLASAIALSPGDEPGAVSADQPARAAFPTLLSFLAGRPVAVFDVHGTLEPLREWCEDSGYDSAVLSDALDIQQLSQILFPTNKDVTLDAMFRRVGASMTDTSRPEHMASALVTVMDTLCARGIELPYMSLQQLTTMAAAISPPLADWFQNVSDKRYQLSGTRLPENVEAIHQLAFSSPPRAGDDASQSPNPSSNAPNVGIAEEAGTLLGAASPLADVMQGFEVRPGQQEMVQAVVQALDGDQHLLAEAGTGTGKSLAYLIPSALYALEHDTRVVVSTHTIALQDQIATRDFPMLRQVIPQPLSLTIFKGRTHYICMRKLLQELRSVGFGTDKGDVQAYMKLLVWLTDTLGGNREELHLQGGLVDVWPRVQSETETCINKRCPFFKFCYYFRARSKAYEADVIVTNHSLVFSDLKANHRVLPRYDKLVLDEAHHLEEQATKHLGDEVHMFQCMALIGRLSRDNTKHGVVPELLQRLYGSDASAITAIPALENMIDTLKQLRGAVEDAFATLARLVPPGETELRITSSVQSSPTWTGYLQLTDTLTELLKDLEAQSYTISQAAEEESDEDLAGRIFDAVGFLQELYGDVQLLASGWEFSDDWVVWIELGNSGERRHVSLHRAPIDVANILRTTLFDSKSTVVLTSATLSVAGAFDHTKVRLGLSDADRDGRLQTIQVASPFRYDQQALLCVPTDVPELAKMSADEAAVWLSDSLFHLARTSGGRLLALFTSHAMLRATALRLREPLKTAGLQLFAQGVDGSRSSLLEAFRSQPHSVLLGAQSFWEGIDLPGDQLTTLVIVRLPFAPPTHPVTQARHDRLNEQGLSPFQYDSLPEAVVRFRQGFGRLIRTVHDRGVVVVMDKRVVTARYGQSFLKSVHGVQKCIGPEQQVIARVKAFLADNGKRSPMTAGTSES